MQTIRLQSDKCKHRNMHKVYKGPAEKGVINQLSGNNDRAGYDMWANRVKHIQLKAKVQVRVRAAAGSRSQGIILVCSATAECGWKTGGWQRGEAGLDWRYETLRKIPRPSDTTIYYFFFFPFSGEANGNKLFSLSMSHQGLCVLFPQDRPH